MSLCLGVGKKVILAYAQREAWFRTQMGPLGGARARNDNSGSALAHTAIGAQRSVVSYNLRVYSGIKFSNYGALFDIAF